jgi:hypothetical protein
MSNEIDIVTVLNKLDHNYDERSQEAKEYGIEFLKADGTFRQMNVRKNVKLKGRNQVRKQMQNLKELGQMLLYDTTEHRHKNIYVATICAFRDHKSTNWQKVRH